MAISLSILKKFEIFLHQSKEQRNADLFEPIVFEKYLILITFSQFLSHTIEIIIDLVLIANLNNCNFNYQKNILLMYYER